MRRPLLSVIVSAYNRPEHIGPLLDSVLAQNFDDWECVVTEDCSPARDQIRGVVEGYVARSGGRIRYHENPENYGYDRSVRTLVSLARGEYLFVMGDDDFVADGAFAAVASAIQRYPNVGVILRAYTFFRDTPDNTIQVNRYYARECSFRAGPDAIVACYRRLVAMSGIVLHRDLAHAVRTSRWDGTLFYQHWLAANILVEKDAVYIPDILAHFRTGGIPLFGTSKSEQGLYTPGVQPPDTDLKMQGNLMAIASAVEADRNIRITDLIWRDMANYSYPAFAHQAHEPWPVFFKYYRDLGRLGFRRYPAFHFWFWTVAILGQRNTNRIIQQIRRWLGHTPNLSRFALPKRQPTPP